MINRSNGLHIRHPFPSSFSLSLDLLIILSFAASASAAPGFWDKIYKSPTPSPEDGPPASAHASRDKRLLPYQICGILGGYLGFVLISLVLLLTVGRRLRRAAEMSPASLEMELMGHPGKGFQEETPISPASTTRSWFKPFKRSSSVKSGSVPNSPGFGSVQSFDYGVQSFDQGVIDTDKESRQREMERLYAAVMEHDAAKAEEARRSQGSATAAAATDLDPEEEEAERVEIQPVSKGRTEKRPPRLLMKAQELARSPTSPVKAIYPPTSPHSNMANPLRHRSPPSGPMSPGYAPPGLPMSPRHVPLPMSPGRPVTTSNRTSLLSPFSSGNKTRKALKNLRISSPIKDYPGVAEHDEARAPLSPRVYLNPGPPPSPPTKEGGIKIASARGHHGGENDYSYEELDKPQPLPMPRTNFSRGPLSPGLQYQQQTVTVNPTQQSAATGNSSLPLRSYNVDAAVPPTPTKVTYLERKKEHLGLITPRTGVPSTPYSPYMPFTPLTPVTPRLMTKKEMKAKKKVEGRRVLSGEDLVMSEKDIWDSGY